MSSLQKARYQPISGQAGITAKVHYDRAEWQRRKANGSSPTVYGLNKDDVNFTVEPGELVFGSRNRRGARPYQTPGYETGMSSLTAYDWAADGDSDEECMRNFYFIGCAKYEDLGPDTDFFGDYSMDVGFSAVKAGSYGTYNNNTAGADIAAGDIVCWTLPPNLRAERAGNQRPALDDGFNSGRQQNVSTMPWTKTLMHTVPFDPNNFVTQRFGIRAALRKLVGQKVAKFQVQAGNPREPLTSLEEEAGAWALGLLGFANRLNVDDSQLGEKFSKDNIDLLEKAFVNAGNGNINGYQNKWFDNICRGVTGCWYAKTSRILGKAMGSAKPGYNLPMMFSHFKIGF